jgi:hypothetical protein
MLEIGVFKGESIKAFREVFKNAECLVGLDINSKCKEYENISENIFIEIGDACNKEFVESIIKKYGQFDIILDDGGHMPNQQKNSFEALFPLLHPNGVYLVEDIQTSYWKLFDGGLRKPNTFMEYSKQLIDYVNVDHFRSEDNLELYMPLKVALCKQLTSVNFYDGMVVFTKGDKTPKRAIHYNGNGNTVEDSLSSYN